MKILHIASYFARQKVYKNLIRQIDSFDVDQYVFVPVRTEGEIGNNQEKELVRVQYNYAFILNRWHKLLYKTKIKKSKRTIEDWLDIKTIDFVHAHCLFSDGGVACLLKRQYGIPYAVAVRNTDFRFFSYMPHLKGFAKKVLENADYIIHLNPSYQIRLDHILGDKFKQHIAAKSRCIPNGIDDFWHKHKGETKDKNATIVNLLFVGAFVPLKNVPLIIEAAKLLSETRKVTVTLIGGGGRIGRGGSDPKTLLAIEKAESEGLDIRFVGKVTDLNEMKRFYRQADIYVMPSKPETFGLVYIEAMSQGTPIIYSKGHGVDGFFPDGDVGYAIEKFTSDEVASRIEEILDNYQYHSERCVQQFSKFKWEEIGRQYFNLYSKR